MSCNKCKTPHNKPPASFFFKLFFPPATHACTSSSARWEIFISVTWLLPPTSHFRAVFVYISVHYFSFCGKECQSQLCDWSWFFFFNVSDAATICKYQLSLQAKKKKKKIRALINTVAVMAVNTIVIKCHWPCCKDIVTIDDKCFSSYYADLGVYMIFDLHSSWHKKKMTFTLQYICSQNTSVCPPKRNKQVKKSSREEMIRWK